MAVQSGHHQIQIQNQSEALERSGSYVYPYHFAETRIAAFSWYFSLLSVCLRARNCMALVEANDGDFLKCRWWKEVNIKVGVTVVPIISIALCALPCAFYVGCLVSIACTALLPFEYCLYCLVALCALWDASSLDLIVSACLTVMGPNEVEKDDYYCYTPLILEDHLTLRSGSKTGSRANYGRRW